MTWVRLDDGFGEHPKIVGLSDAAYRMHVNAICYCARNLTNGVIPAGMVKVLGKAGKPVRDLVEAGLWDVAADGYQIHDYLDYNPSREQVERERKVVSDVRSAAGRRGAQARWRDGNGDGKPIANGMANGMANGWQTDGPVPDPVPLPDPLTPKEPIGSFGVGMAQAPKRTRRTATIEVITESEFEELAAKYGREEVQGKLDYGRNRQDWETKYKSEYATVKRWCEDDARKAAKDDAGLVLSDEERVKRFTSGRFGAFIRTGADGAK